MAGVPRAKTTAPRLPLEFVPRPALVAALDRGETCALTLVTAPPGYGKTVLLAEWAAQSEGACAWVSLDEDDDDPRRLWSAVLAALAACPDIPESGRLRNLVVPRTEVGVEFLTELSEALATIPARVRLVLDDAHHLHGQATLHGLEFLLRDHLSNVRLLLASRFDPALPVGRLRLEERLCELRPDHLAFSVGETEALAGLCGLHLDRRQAALLHARTDGWVAGIRLAALPLRDHPAPDDFIAAFSGDERPVADYLADEVLSRLSEAEGDLLRRISICDPVPSALAVELSGRADAPETLGRLERSTALVMAGGPHRDEFRIQELIRSYLAADLLHHGPALAAQLHRQAAVWWADRRRPTEALRHAARANDTALETELLHRWAPELVARGEHIELRRALDSLQTGSTAPDAWLPLVSAHIQLGRGDWTAARADVRRAGGLGPGAGDRDLTHFRIATRRMVGLGGSAPDDSPSYAGAPPEDAALAALVLAGRGAGELFSMAPARSAEDDWPALFRHLEAALVVASEQHFGLLEVQCLFLIGAAALTSGDNGRARSAAEAAITAGTAGGWQDTPWTAGAHAVLAQACLTGADPARALQVSSDGLRIPSTQEDRVIRFALRCARGGALFDIGNRPAGLLELQEAHAGLGAEPIPESLATTAALLEHRMALVLDLPVAAGTSVGRLTVRAGADAELMLMRAWAEAAAGSAASARSAVAPLLSGQVRPILPSTIVEAWLVEVWADLRLGRRSAARRALQAALTCAEPLDVLRPFALAGQAIRVLLVDQLGGSTDPAAFAFRCLSVRPQVRRPPAPRLSAREQGVLIQLNSLNNLGEIADDMDVSVNTIKSHVRAIYGKLGVTTRRTAVLTALEHGLMT